MPEDWNRDIDREERVWIEEPRFLHKTEANYWKKKKVPAARKRQYQGAFFECLVIEKD